ncbi:MAG TPA: MoaD/ThiS family protein [Gammaproteobacteria bacterium]|nr:MoaD/ThiS family protein [Gammaproteobacteria bacterium]
MVIHIKYFASLRETVGKQEEELEASAAATVGDVWRAANPELAPPDNTLAAVNQVYGSFDTAVQAGDEVAFFPPVTGG